MSYAFQQVKVWEKQKNMFTCYWWNISFCARNASIRSASKAARFSWEEWADWINEQFWVVLNCREDQTLALEPQSRHASFRLSRCWSSKYLNSHKSTKDTVICMNNFILFIGLPGCSRHFVWHVFNYMFSTMCCCLEFICFSMPWTTSLQQKVWTGRTSLDWSGSVKNRPTPFVEN